MSVVWNAGRVQTPLIKRIQALNEVMKGNVTTGGDDRRLSTHNSTTTTTGTGGLNQLLQQQATTSMTQQAGLLAAALSNNAAQANVRSVPVPSISSTDMMRLQCAALGGSTNNGGVLMSQNTPETLLRRLQQSGCIDSGSQGLIATTAGVQQIPERREENFKLPCQARGMPVEHDSSTAYFEITPKTCHGQRLHCSFPECRKAGVKFRYCYFCKKPVTKQNFRARHLHANLANPFDPLTTSKDERRTSSSSTILKEEIKRHYIQPPQQQQQGSHLNAAYNRTLHQQCQAISTVPDAMARLQEVFCKNNESVIQDSKLSGLLQKKADLDKKKADLDKKKVDAKNTPEAAKSTQPNPNTNIIGAYKSKLFPSSSATNKSNPTAMVDKLNRRRKWNSLLLERPRGFTNMDKWFSQVLSVSDPSKSYNSSISFNSSHGRKLTAAQRCNWSTLLGERPATNDDDAINSWLNKVLRVSSGDNPRDFVKKTNNNNECQSTLSSTQKNTSLNKDKDDSARVLNKDEDDSDQVSKTPTTSIIPLDESEIDTTETDGRKEYKREQSDLIIQESKDRPLKKRKCNIPS